MIKNKLTKIKMKTKTLRISTALLALAIFSLANMTAFAAADTKSPSDVENFKGTALDLSVKLTWDAATDNVAVTGYKVYYGLKPVVKSGEAYDSNKDVGNVLSHTLTGLTNDKKYYFSVVAYDAAGNESGSWAKEISLTPVKGAAGSDKEAPKVSKAEALNKEQVKVTFSESVVLPQQDPQDAFAVEDDNFKPLVILKAEMDKDDKEEKTVVLTTAVQKKDAKYKLTVGIDMKDKAGNPVISGTSDTAGFTGSDLEKPAEDKKSPEVVKVESMDATHVIVTFNEGIVLGIDPSKNFSVMQEADSKKTLDVLGVELGKNSAGIEDASAIVTTAAQENVKYAVVVSGVKDADNNEINPAKGSGTFIGASAKAEKDNGDKIKDIIPPKDILNLLAKKTLDAKNYIVTLTWSMPKENKGDVKEQIVYMGTDGDTYDKKASLDADAVKYEIKNMEPGEYWFKVTEKDAAGNESKGAIVKVKLAETGPELIGLFALSIGLGRVFTRRKK